MNKIRRAVAVMALLAALFGLFGCSKAKNAHLREREIYRVEALFRATDDAGASAEYFAVQGEQLLRLDFTEELFEQTTAEFLSRHG